MEGIGLNLTHTVATHSTPPVLSSPIPSPVLPVLLPA